MLKFTLIYFLKNENDYSSAKTGENSLNFDNNLSLSIKNKYNTRQMILPAETQIMNQKALRPKFIYANSLKRGILMKPSSFSNGIKKRVA